MPSPHGTAGTPDLFETPTSPEPRRRRPAGVAPADVAPELTALATRLSPLVHLGTSSWSFPGWQGLVYDGEYSPAQLARSGLAAYAAHPLLRSVSLDRSFYRAMAASEYAALAAQVPPDFRFVVKAAASVTDAVLREPGSGRPAQPNPLFLDPALALAEVLQPATEGLGERLGALVFQLSPLPRPWLAEPQRLLGALDRLFGQLPRPPHGVLALELRDAALLTPELAALLKAQGVRWCLGLHDRMPPIEEQLPMLRASWPGPLVCRWNLQRGLAYGEAKDLFEPFNRLQAPDLGTREVLARVIAATAAAGHAALVTINNKAEGSAPCSVLALADAVARHAAASAGR
ncbi:MAG TPA: DUF72 domain-containing protein [Methylibium sp.]|nr:DUF72 domain-containing protein [Methylibium sp.]